MFDCSWYPGEMVRFEGVGMKNLGGDEKRNV